MGILKISRFNTPIALLYVHLIDIMSEFGAILISANPIELKIELQSALLSRFFCLTSVSFPKSESGAIFNETPF